MMAPTRMLNHVAIPVDDTSEVIDEVTGELAWKKLFLVAAADTIEYVSAGYYVPPAGPAEFRVLHTINWDPDTYEHDPQNPEITTGAPGALIEYVVGEWMGGQPVGTFPVGVIESGSVWCRIRNNLHLSVVDDEWVIDP